MKLKTLKEELGSTAYPGRGILLGRSADGKKAVIGYFIMGRSVNSRNRVFVTDGDGLKTKAFDESKMVDPSLIIYNPVLVLGDTQIVTNGDQTDTIYTFLKEGKTFEEALRTRTFEPDSPNFTPRISGIIDSKTGAYKLSVLKSDCGDEASVQRFFYEYAQPKAGEGHFIHTYMGDGEPLPSFEGEPQLVSIPNDIETFTNTVWESLNDENKVSLFTRFIDLETGETESRICNKNEA
ncbi:MAG: IMP cyclohydrolase [Hydrogeniiclostridium sp.]